MNIEKYVDCHYSIVCNMSGINCKHFEYFYRYEINSLNNIKTICEEPNIHMSRGSFKFLI